MFSWFTGKSNKQDSPKKEDENQKLDAANENDEEAQKRLKDLEEEAKQAKEKEEDETGDNEDEESSESTSKSTDTSSDKIKKRKPFKFDFEKYIKKVLKKMDDVKKITLNCEGQELTWEEVDNEYEIISTARNEYLEKEYITNEDRRWRLNQMIEIFKPFFPRSVTSTATLIQFLIARKWNMKKTCQMYSVRMLFVKRRKPHRITADEVAECIAEKKACWVGHDLVGRPVITAIPGRHKPGHNSTTWKFACFMVERGRRMLPTDKPEVHQFAAVYNHRGLGWSNFDLFAFRLFACMGDYWPEFLGHVYIVNTDWIFSTLFAIVKQFLDERTVKKLHVCKNPDGKTEEIQLSNMFQQTFSNDFRDKDAMLAMYGGNLPFPDLETERILHEKSWTAEDLKRSQTDEKLKEIGESSKVSTPSEETKVEVQP